MTDDSPHRLVADPEVGGQRAQALSLREGADGGLLIEGELTRLGDVGHGPARLPAHAARGSRSDDHDTGPSMTQVRDRPPSLPP